MLFILYFMSPDSCGEGKESDDKAEFNKKPSLEILASGSENEGEKETLTLAPQYTNFIFIENFSTALLSTSHFQELILYEAVKMVTRLFIALYNLIKSLLYNFGII